MNDVVDIIIGSIVLGIPVSIFAFWMIRGMISFISNNPQEGKVLKEGRLYNNKRHKELRYVPSNTTYYNNMLTSPSYSHLPTNTHHYSR